MPAYTTTLTPEEIKRRTILKFELLAAADLDDALNANAFRFFFRVMSQLDLGTWTSTISFRRICAEVPNIKDRKSASDHRQKIEAAGYWETEPGASGHTTRYFIAEAIPDRALKLIEAKKAAYQAKREAEKAAEKGAAQPRTKRKKRSEVGGSGTPGEGAAQPPVLFRGSHTGYRETDETPPASAPAPAPMPARAVPPPPEDDDWLDDLPQGNSAPSEFRVSNSIRCNCGEPAICEIRLIGGGPFEPHCVECAEDTLPIEVRPIPVGRIASRAPAPSGQPIKAKDTVADYRRARDGS